MAEYVHVQLTFQTAHLESVKEIMVDWDDYQLGEVLGLSYINIDEVRDGELDFLGKLQSKGIAYESSWDGCYTFSPGVDYCRFTDEGECTILTVYEEQEHMCIDHLLKLTETPLKLIEEIKQQKKQITPLPWDNQEQYGKLYRTKQLLITKEK